MKFLLVLAVAIVACAAVSVMPKKDAEGMDAWKDLMESEDDIEFFPEGDDGDVEISPQNIFTRWQVNRAIRKFQKQMPCKGLAPVRIDSKEFSFEQGFFKTDNSVDHLRIDGFDGFKLKSFKFNPALRRIKFDAYLPFVQFSSPRYSTNTVIDAIEPLGISVKVEATDKVKVVVRKMHIKGVLKYATPILWGSNKITSLKTTTTVEEIISDIDGLAGNGKLNRLTNSYIEKSIETLINTNQKEISDKIENFIVPKVNKQLKGTDFWDIIALVLNYIEGEKEDDPIPECYPPPDPWA